MCRFQVLSFHNQKQKIHIVTWEYVSSIRKTYLRVLIVAFLILCGCKNDDSRKLLVKLESRLDTYDFDGSTPEHLHKICNLVEGLKEHGAARAQWICAKTALDWYLWAAFRQDGRQICKLAKHLGLDCSIGNGFSSVGLRILDLLAMQFEQVRTLDIGGRYDWPAQQAIKLIKLQRDKSHKWDSGFLSGVRDLCDKKQPVEVEAGVLVAGAAIHMVDVLSKTKWSRRPALLNRTLGFECSAGSINGENRKSKNSRSCVPACKEMRRRLIQSPPELRKRLIAAHCPLEHLGFSRREQTLYVSLRGMKTVRNLRFIFENFQRLLQNKDHPLVSLLSSDLKLGLKKWERLVFPLPYPELSPGETGHIKLPYSAIAEKDVFSPVSVVADDRRVLVGVLPMLRVDNRETVILGDREGYRFPGRLVPEPLGIHLPAVVRSARKTWTELSESAEWKPVGLYLDGDVKGPRFNNILGSLARMGLEQARLFFRHDRHEVGSVSVGFKTIPAGKFRKSEKRSSGVALYLDKEEMFLTASEGKLSEKPFISQTGDLAGLREHLEISRRGSKDVNAVEVFLTGEIDFLAVSRVLVAVKRNSSGRTLYPNVIFVVPEVETD